MGHPLPKDVSAVLSGCCTVLNHLLHVSKVAGYKVVQVVTPTRKHGVCVLPVGGPAILSATAVGAVVGAVAGGAVEKEAERGVELDRVCVQGFRIYCVQGFGIYCVQGIRIYCVQGVRLY